jgi:hypothetical protein
VQLRTEGGGRLISKAGYPCSSSPSGRDIKLPDMGGFVQFLAGHR